MFRRSDRRTVIALLMALLFGAVLQPLHTYAQDAADLVVSLLDENDSGVFATIIVRDTAGIRDLARTTTDAQGIATIATLPVSEVRVAIDGSLPNGTRLFQRGDDTQGIYLLLNAGSTRLDLRVDPDGAVAPDPRTMVAQEGASYDGVALPTAPVAAPQFASPTGPQPTLPRTSPIPHQLATTAKEQPAKNGFPLGSMALVVVLSLGIAGVLVVRRKV